MPTLVASCPGFCLVLAEAAKKTDAPEAALVAWADSGGSFLKWLGISVRGDDGWVTFTIGQLMYPKPLETLSTRGLVLHALTAERDPRGVELHLEIVNIDAQSPAVRSTRELVCEARRKEAVVCREVVVPRGE